MQLRHDLIQIIIFIGGDHTVHGTLFTQDLGQRTGIDTGNAGNIITLQKILNRIFAAEIARHTGKFANDIAVRPGS